MLVDFKTYRDIYDNTELSFSPHSDVCSVCLYVQLSVISPFSVSHETNEDNSATFENSEVDPNLPGSDKEIDYFADSAEAST